MVDRATYGPIAGNMFTLNPALTSSVVLAEGPNQSWNVTLSTTGGCRYQIFSRAGPAATGIQTQAEFHYIWYLSSGSLTSYYLNTPTGLELIGTRSPSEVEFMTPYPRLIPYGLPIGQTSADNFTTYDTSRSGAASLYMTSDTSSYVGYGSLTLNGVAYSDAYLLKVMSSVFSRDAGAPNFTLDFIQTYYAIVVPHVGYPIIETYHMVQPSGVSNDFVQYLSDIVTTSKSTFYIACQAWPKPATDKIHIDLPFVSAGESVTFTDNLGKAVWDTKVENNVVDISRFAPGVYRATVLHQGKQYAFQITKM